MGHGRGFTLIVLLLVVVVAVIVGVAWVHYYYLLRMAAGNSLTPQATGAEATSTSSAATPAAANAAATARDLTRLSDLKLVSTELELYYNQCGFYPGGVIKDGVCPQSHVSISTWGDDHSGLTQVLLDSGLGITDVPQDPLPGATYYYGTDAAGDHYLLAAKLE